MHQIGHSIGSPGQHPRVRTQRGSMYLSLVQKNRFQFHPTKFQNLKSENFSDLQDRFCIQFFVLRQRPRTSLQCFALYKLCSKAKHCRDVLGRCLRTKNKIETPPSVAKKAKFAGQKLFSVFGPATFFQFKSETHFRL